MGKSMTPGPPLEAGDEFCENEPPSRWEDVKAIFVALLVTLLLAAAQFGLAIALGRIWGIAALVASGLAGYLVHLGAGHHRSRAIGIMASSAAVLAAGLSYGLLMVPLLYSGALVRPPLGIYLALVALGAFAAYRIAGPDSSEPPL